jgi:ribose 5-phosphate isomerase B
MSLKLERVLNKMKIYIGSDHAGYEMKEKLKTFLVSSGYEVEDRGVFALDKKDDYPDFIKPVALAVASDKNSLGIILGMSGQGEAICANKVHGVRAVVYYGDQYPRKWFGSSVVQLTREHNNANILALGARFISFRKAKKAVKIFLETKFSGDERHIRRINKIEN